ncbi:DUF4157 domain-containing protein [Sphingoaurantiacus capsulatus]|uniref:DUF4157 domain-containing protein n=1 Tax=Sphingoaurantiacus capsulatus TaxID=1771310 RepID=A0ABV7X6N8_9SPHN
MKLRSILAFMAAFAGGTFAGYFVAYGTGAPVPTFVTALRFDILARIDEAKLRAALRGPRLVAQTVRRGGNVAASATLAEAIRFSRVQALKGHSQPLSDELKELYRPYFPDEVIDDTRWTLADRRVGLGSLLAGWHSQDGAVTLDDVIVFSNGKAAGHRALVAHELTHVLQYHQLGLPDFARLYAQNWPLIEEQARRNAGRILADIARREAMKEEASEAAPPDAA